MVSQHRACGSKLPEAMLSQDRQEGVSLEMPEVLLREPSRPIIVTRQGTGEAGDSEVASPPWAQHAPHFPKQVVQVRDMFENMVGVHEIEMIARESTFLETLAQHMAAPGQGTSDRRRMKLHADRLTHTRL